MFKGQGQTTLLSPLCCPLNIFWPLYLINIKLGAGVALMSWFSGHMFKGQGQTTRSISFDPFTWSIQNLVKGLHPISRWSLFIFKSHVQRSRSNYRYSFETSVLSTLYILILCLIASDRFCFYREDKPCTMGGIDVSETFLVSWSILSSTPSYISDKLRV